MPDETLTTFTAGGGKQLGPLPFQTFAQLRLSAALLSISLLPLPQFAMKGAVVATVRGG
jgi:hypothetical protein